MNTLQEALRTNNEGVQLLIGGSIVGALHAFQSAITAMKDAAASSHAAPSSHDETPHTISLMSDRTERFFSLEQRQGSLAGIQNEHCYVYDRPLLIPSNPELLSEDEVDTFITTSSLFIIFNFAIACHQQGKVSGNEFALQRAGQLYNLTLKILATKGINSELLTVLQCLAPNNLAQLHYDQCDYQTSQSCVKTMHDLVVTTDCLEDYLDETVAEEILLNLTYLQTPTAARAA